MLYNEDTYCNVSHRCVRELGAMPSIVLSTINGLLQDNETGSIANGALCDILGITVPGLRKILTKLIGDGYLIQTTSTGRGNKTIYTLTEKGKLCFTFSSQKRETLFQKKVNFVSKKGKQSFTINKELNKELNLSRTQARVMDGEEKDFNVMENFNQFWKLFAADAEYQNRRMACVELWSNMDDNYKHACLVKLERNGKPDEPNPYYYLQHFAPELLNGTKLIEKKIAAGEHIVQVKVMDKEKRQPRFDFCTFDEAQLFGLDITKEHFWN